MAEKPFQHSIQPRARSSRLGFSVESSCVICSEQLEGKTYRNANGGRTAVKCHRLETTEAWESFSNAVQYVEDEKQRNRLQALVTHCDNDGGILKAAALDIRYHKDCWKTYCRPVYNKHMSAVREEERRLRHEWVTTKQEEAFKKLCCNVKEWLDVNKEVYTLRDLLCEYEQIQRDMAICNDEIRNTCDDRHALRSLRKQLENHFGKDIAFQSRYRRNESSFVFSPNMAERM